jgi:hypothetical protein
VSVPVVNRAEVSTLLPAVTILLLPSILLLAAVVPCQAAAPPRVVCSLPGQDPPWLVRVQAADGRFPARWEAAGAASEGRPAADEATQAPPSEEDVTVTALATLALLGDGSTLRSGPHRDAVKRAVRWLCDQRDAEQRIGLSSRPDWILGHAIATAALCEAARLSDYLLMSGRIVGPLEVLVDHLRRFEDGVDVELLLWCRICARSAQLYTDWRNERPEATACWDIGAEELDFQVARLARAGAVGSGARSDAARVLLASLAPVPPVRAELEVMARPLVEEGWPEAAEDPLTFLYRALAIWRLGGPAWRAVAPRLGAEVEAQSRELGLAGSWAPRGAFGRNFGRVGTTAARLLTMELYYRYSRLDVAAGR